MPSRRTNTAAINERISQAQKDRTRLACSTCRARRIKCDGQLGVCGRCQDDKRSDCRYENVGSAERLAGRQRKRALRKQHNTSISSTNSLLLSPHTQMVDNVPSVGDWSTNLLTTTIPPLLPPPHISSSASFHGKSEDSSSLLSKTPTSTHSFGSSSRDEATQPSHFSSLASSMGPSDSQQLPSSGPNFSWMPTEVSPEAPLRLSGSCFDPANTESLLVQPVPGEGTDTDYGAVDALWRVYDWQYRCNTGMA